MPSFRLRLLFGFAIAAFLAIVPLVYRSHYLRDFRNFHVVEDGILYRSAQVSLPGFQRLFHDYRFRAVVCIRNGDKADDQAEEKFCRENGIRFVRIPPKQWSSELDGIVPAEDGLRTFLDVMDDPSNHPVLIHCFAGTHRTGAYVAVYRMERDGWSNEKAMQEVRSYGYVRLEPNLDRDVFEYLREYRPHLPRSLVTALPVSRGN
jgi:tyrosine-protein phosphatase SIW14